LKAVAGFVMSGLLQAIVTALGFMLLSLVFPPLGILSGAVIALVALREGYYKASIVTVVLIVTLSLLAKLVAQPASLGLLSGIMQWVPVLLLALVLRVTSSWTNVMQLLLIAALTVILVVHAVVPDLPGYWLAVLEKYVQPMLVQAGMPDLEIDRVLPQLSRVMTGVLAVSVVVSAFLMLMLGRVMQASLYNPGGFAAEFANLRMGLWPAALTFGLILMATLFKQPMLIEAVVIALGLFFFQGLAVIHGLSRRLKWPTGILFVLYVMLILFFTPFAALLAVMGLIDAFADLRSRVAGQ